MIRIMPPPRALPSIQISCFGGFKMSLKGGPLDLSAIKPRARAVLRMLALHAGDPVHREVLQEAFWPEADGETGGRNLHVAISTLRQALEPGVLRGGYTLLLREGDAYRLAVPPDGEVDLVQFSQAVSAGRMARLRGERVEAIGFFRQALELYGGELLPEDGPAEWVLELRERCRNNLVDAARALAELLLQQGEWAEAAQACVTGLWVDRYHDSLWRLLIDARERAGDRARTTPRSWPSWGWSSPPRSAQRLELDLVDQDRGAGRTPRQSRVGRIDIDPDSVDVLGVDLEVLQTRLIRQCQLHDLLVGEHEMDLGRPRLGLEGIGRGRAGRDKELGDVVEGGELDVHVGIRIPRSGAPVCRQVRVEHQIGAVSGDGRRGVRARLPDVAQLADDVKLTERRLDDAPGLRPS
ncbi:MAG: hypothetical protein E6J00_01645 [Chloroflexi bacterium]|nr:MAG: hypothetical protein E6J00_01645 [Chloroflexota bacterium]